MEVLTDSKGRKLEIERPSSRELMRLIRTCGQAWEIGAYAANASMAYCVRSIDGIPVPRPMNVDQVDALPGMVGAEGMAAVQEWAAALTEENSDDTAAAAKN